jgi:hypothetical protein
VTEAEEGVWAEVEGALELLDGFHRDQPAHLEGPEEAWALARQVIDHGFYVLQTANAVREGRAVRDTVTGALLRRALITSEAVRILASSGLEEAAAASFRTLLDVRLNLRLVTRDPSDEMAQRLAAYHYLGARRHIQKILADPGQRDALKSRPEHDSWLRETARRMKGFFMSESFAEVRDKVSAARHWHGYKNVEDAFDAAGMGQDYRTLYSTYSQFVHASNVDFDFSEIDADGKIHLKALPQRDPRRNLSILMGMCLNLVQFLKDFVQDKGELEYQPAFRGLVDGEEVGAVHPLDALLVEVMAVYHRDDANGGSG